MNKRRSKDDFVEDPSREFLEAVKDVTPLPDPGRVVHAPKAPEPIPAQRLEDDRRVLEDSLSDSVPADLELEAGDELSFVREGLSRQILRKLRSGQWSMQDQLDLHGSRTEEARQLLSEFLSAAIKRGYRCVLVVHGRGRSSPNREPVLKRKVAGWLAQHRDVLAFCQARPADGGSGAVMVLLRATGAKAEARAAEEDEED
jgi:DNA-nicking Smr family endonuclease